MSFSKMRSPQFGYWIPNGQPPVFEENDLVSTIQDITRPVSIVGEKERPGAGPGGYLSPAPEPPASHPQSENGLPLLAWAPAIQPESLGDAEFRKTHGVKYAYVAGAMAGGITSVEMVREMGRAGMLGFFGAAGLSVPDIEAAIDALQTEEESIPFGFNLIHSPSEGDLEMETVRLYLRKGVNRISAAAFMKITPALVLFRLKGAHRDKTGRIIIPNKIFAKVSRIEVADKFLSPPPEKLVGQLHAQGLLTPEEADLAGLIPMAEDITAEADSGGHTDNRPAIALFPTLSALRDAKQEEHRYPVCPRIGLAGGISTPASAAAAFAMGAAYILTGSVNQACVESGTSTFVKQILADVQQADVTMAPSADMFEMGVKVQVVKRGTMFAMRAQKLYELYRQYEDFRQVPENQRKIVEEKFLQQSFEAAWEQTRSFFQERDPRQIDRALSDPKHKMALVFRSYLGLSSKWAIAGNPDRKIDFQIWCGPAMGAFNEWTRNSALAAPEQRKVVTVALNLLLGAAIVMRCGFLAMQGVALPAACRNVRPMTMDELRLRLHIPSETMN